MVEHTVEATISAKHLGERLGITTQAVQELGYAADVSGLKASVLQSGLQRLSYGLQQTGTHAHGAASAINQLKLGISSDELKKMPLDEQLGKLADGFKKMGAGSKANTLAMQIFGRTAGPQMVPLLLEGSEGIKELREEAERLGVSMSDEGVEKAEAFEKAQKRLQARIGAVKDKIVMALLPALEAMVNGFSTVVDFFTSHEDVMIAVIAAIGAAIVKVGISAALAWAPVLIPFLAFIAAVGIVVAVVAKLQTYLSGVSKVILGIALIFALWFAPLTAAVALITLIASNWDDVVEMATNFWDAFKNAAEAVGDFIADLPVIKQLIELYHWAAAHGNSDSGAPNPNYNPSAPGSDFITDADVAQALGHPVRADGAGTTGDTHVHVTNGPTNVNVTGVQKEDVVDAMRIHNEDTLRQAYAASKKGG